MKSTKKVKIFLAGDSITEGKLGVQLRFGNNSGFRIHTGVSFDATISTINNSIFQGLLQVPQGKVGTKTL